MASFKPYVGYRGTPLERFLRKIRKEDGGCWIWLATKDKRGYGRFSMGPGKYFTANYASWLLFKGPLGPGMETDHLCRNPSCVNPDHLEAVTHKENVLRGMSPCAINARKERCIRGHKLEPPNIYILKNGAKAGNVQCGICRTIRRNLLNSHYPGQAYFHRHNANIRKAEETWCLKGLETGGWRPKR